MGPGPTPVLAQEGLVLGAGGSRGLAHGGVIEGLERLGYDPDLVVGVSMGAIVGALYAAGRTPAEVRSVLEEEDWHRLFEPPALAVGAEGRRRMAMLRLPLGPRRRTDAGGLLPAWRVNRRLVQLLFDAGVRSGGDFDRLPRRFRAVAADLASGEAVVLGSGDLARAVRTSMGVPGVFAPMLHDGRLLVDGGIAEYLPVGLARALGADFVLAADVLRPRPEPEGFGAVTLGLRSVRLVLGNTLDVAARPDVLIVPDIDADFAESTFPRDATPLLDAGLRAAMKDGARGAVLEVDAPARARPAPPVGPPLRVGPLVVETPDEGLARLIRRAFGPLAGAPYHPAAVHRAVDRLYATGLFEGVWPHIPSDAGQAGDRPLVVRAEAVPRSFLAGAVAYDNDRDGRVWGGVRWRRPGGIAVWSADARWGKLGRSADVAVHLAATGPVTEWSLGSTYGVTEVRGRPLEGGDLPEVRRLGGWAGLRSQRPGPPLELVVRLRAERVETGAAVAGWTAGPYVRLSGADPFGMPVGGASSVEAEARVGELAYRRIRGRLSLPAEAGPVLLAGVAELAVVGGAAPGDVEPALGDGFEMPGLRWGEGRGRALALAGLDAAYPLSEALFARVRGRVAATAGDLDGLTASERWLAGAELAAVLVTPLGDVVVGWGANTRGGEGVRIELGPSF